jgi:carboxypeptidase C (cathepsin A)
MLISSVLNFLTLSYDSGNDLPYPMLLPSFTATAWYHKRLAPELQTDLQQTLREAEQFAATDYTLALMKGSAISPEERQQTIRQLSRYLGLSERFLHDHDMRVNTEQFCKELLRDQSLTVGRLDSRFTGQEKDNAADYPERDPSYSAILGPYTGAFYDYVRGELKFEKDLPYEIIKRLGKWQMEEGNYTNVSDALRNGFFLNPSLRVLVACGLYDLATPYFAAEYTINHLSLPPNLAERITTTYYPSGHMMYLHLPSLEKLSADLKEFIAASLPQR